MTDNHVLYEYRKKQSDETFYDAEIMLNNGGSFRSVINRLYYAAFYRVLALFLKFGIAINSSKHSGIIGIFDKEFIVSKKIDKKYSKILHSLFDDRQEFDYKEFVEVTKQDAENARAQTSEFISAIDSIIDSTTDPV